MNNKPLASWEWAILVCVPLFAPFLWSAVLGMFHPEWRIVVFVLMALLCWLITPWATWKLYWWGKAMNS